jgi:hypothetical protein
MWNRIYAAAIGTLTITSWPTAVHADFFALQLDLFDTVQTTAGTVDVYRVYAVFTAGGDRVAFWGGSPGHPMVIKTFPCLPAPNFFNPGGPAVGNRAPYQKDIDANPDLQWGTFATIGVSLADQGSGPPDAPDVTSLSPGFPNFIAGNLLNTSNAGVLMVGDGPETAQARADYAADGDPALRVLLMQLAVPTAEGVHVTIGQLGWRPEGSSNAMIAFDENTTILEAQGRCCTESGECFFSTLSGCLQFGNNTWLGCQPCTLCVPACATDFAPPGGDGFVTIDDLFFVIENWGSCGKECPADIIPQDGDGDVNIDELTAVILTWGECE